MIRKAVILSAGQGKRLFPLTEQRPKCLLQFNGRTLVEWQIAALAQNGIREVVVVTGFQAEAVDATLRAHAEDGVEVRCLYNPFFEVADNVGSCYMARHEMLGEDFVLINGDTLFEPRLLASAMTQATAVEAGTPITVTVDHKDRYDADDMKVHRDERGRLLAIGKDLTADRTNAESIGMLFFTGDGGRIFSEALERVLRAPSGLKLWYLSVINALAAVGQTPIGTAPIHGFEWCEVDYPKDLTAAEQLTAHLWRSRAASGSSAETTNRAGGVV